MNNFKIGDKVVCIYSFNDWGHINHETFTSIPEKDATYKIDGFNPEHSSFVYLEGFNKKYSDGGIMKRECFHRNAFRKVLSQPNLSKALAEEFIKQDSEVKEIDVPERVFSLTEDF